LPSKHICLDMRQGHFITNWK